MKLKNLRLTLANVNRTTNQKHLEVEGTSVNRVRLEDGTLGRDIQNYVIECLAYRGDTLKVKVPKELADKVTKLADALGDDVRVNAVFRGLKLRAYALKGEGGSIISGVSATAEDFDFFVEDADDLPVTDTGNEQVII